MIRWAVVLCCLLGACARHDELPEGIIPQAKMEDVMWDMLQADRFVNEFLPKPGDSTYNTRKVLEEYQKVFDVHKISRDEFLRSYKFYLSRPDLAKVMFDSIAPRAERRRSEVYRKQNKLDSVARKNRTDSLKRLRPDSMAKLRFDSLARIRPSGSSPRVGPADSKPRVAPSGDSRNADSSRPGRFDSLRTRGSILRKKIAP